MKQKRCLLDEVSVGRFNFVAWMGFVGHPAYWCFWHFYYPQYLDSVFLRFGPAFVFLLLLLKNYWPSRLIPFSNSIWHFALMLALPSIFTYTLLANNYNSLWLATHVGMLLLLQTAVQYARIFFLLLVPGTITGILWYKLTIGGDALAQFPIEYIPLFLFVTVIGLSFLHLSTQNIIEAARRLENEKQKVEQGRQKAHHLKTLAGSIAHEMRNPLAQIHGNLHLIQEQIPYLNAQAAEHINDAHKVIKSGLQVIDLTMDAIRDKPIDPDSFVLLSAQDLVVESVADFAYAEAEHSDKVSVKGGDFKIMAEPVMVKYVLYNLIKNALYYVKTLPDAEIIICVMPITHQIEVRDTGPGIEPEAISKLFDGFYTAGKQGGTGLGLPYCKRTMTALGGEIRCESELGKHTTFTLSFPVLSAQQIEQGQQQQQKAASKTDTAPKPIESVSLAGKTVLLAEDERTSRMIVKGILEKQGIHCLESENGQEALDLLSAHNCDLILTDIHMPVINGLELIQTVRRREKTTNNTPMPIIALTSEEGDMVDVAMQLGIHNCLPKPVSAERLVSQLQQLLIS